MKLLFGLALLASTARADVAFSVDNPFDYGKGTTGSKSCVLINMVMDESESMADDQAFMRSDQGVPRLVGLLKDDNFDHIFICSHGYGHHSDQARHVRYHGCALGETWSLPTPTDDELSVMHSWNYTGSTEDSYEAIVRSIEMVPREIDGVDLHNDCAYIKKNMILVTDEDRDYVSNSHTFRSVLDAVEQNGFILNVIANIAISNDDNDIILGTSQSADQLLNGTATIYKYTSDNVDGFEVKTSAVSAVSLTSGNHSEVHYSVFHYQPLIMGEAGAIWNIGLMRSDVYVSSMSRALAEIKRNEIRDSPKVPPMCTDPSCFPPTRPPLTETTSIKVGSKGDPHFKTWKQEHFEYHGQCDMILAQDKNFADGLGLEVQIRTKLVRFWSYIKSAAIRIGEDILEVQGNADPNDSENAYWINFEYQKELKTIGGFPVTIRDYDNIKRVFEIHLDSKYPGQKITIAYFKEFIKVDFENGSEESYGNSVGLLGDFKTGKTLARDGVNVIHDFVELGREWQVLPSEHMLFHDVEQPQFPERCLEPEDPRGERRRRLGESAISESEAEKACASIADPLDRKECIYDVLATQDLDMVGAY